MSSRRKAQQARAQPPALSTHRHVPAELLDDTAPMWTSRDEHLAYMTERGWSVDVMDRLLDTYSGGASPYHRRLRALHAWCREHGVEPPDA